jgi:hypothetical protein
MKILRGVLQQQQHQYQKKQQQEEEEEEEEEEQQQQQQQQQQHKYQKQQTTYRVGGEERALIPERERCAEMLTGDYPAPARTLKPADVLDVQGRGGYTRVGQRVLKRESKSVRVVR